MKKCLNFIVYYDNYTEVKKYIDSAFSATKRDVLDIVIVNNSDSKNEFTKLKKYIDSEYSNNIILFDYGDNIGYLNAFLKPIEKVDIDAYEYFILSNTDIIYDTKYFIDELMNRKYENNVGCVAPSIFALQEKSFSNPHYKNRIAKKKYKFLSLVFSKVLLAKIYLWIAKKKSAFDGKRKLEEKSQYVYAPHGAYMIFTKQFVSKIKGYNYGTTLYSEEACIGELLIQNEMRCFFDNTLKVLHDESTITGKINYKVRFKLWKESIDYILKTFY